MSNILKGPFGSQQKQAQPEINLSGDRKTRADGVMALLLKDTTDDNNVSGARMTQVQTVSELETVPDLLGNGQERNRRWGAMLSIAVIPGLEQVPVGPLSLPSVPFTFYVSDKVEDIKERLLLEVEKAVAAATLMVEDPEAYEYVIQKFSDHLIQAARNAASPVEEPATR